nr:Calcium-binding EF-hand [Ipomoea batatas]
MAIKNYARSTHSDGKLDMTLEEFKKWFRRFDADRDGRISREELREAIRAAGVRFSWLKGRKGMKAVDGNGNGFIDDCEIDKLVEFAQMNLNIRIVTAPSDGKLDMTLEEFKKWVRTYDADRDGRINREELQEAIHATGGRLCWFKGRQGMKAADGDGNGFIDDNEMDKLVDFAQKNLNLPPMFFLVLFVVSNLAGFSPFWETEQGKGFRFRFRVGCLVVVGCLLGGYGGLEGLVFYGEGKAVHGGSGGAWGHGEVGEEVEREEMAVEEDFVGRR